jgi:D-arabinose 1-dehydrogenase-like Zn-dependent alcohol dehydrogenase
LGNPTVPSLKNVFVDLLNRNRQEVVEALQIAAQGKVKCQYEIKELDDLNR